MRGDPLLAEHLDLVTQEEEGGGGGGGGGGEGGDDGGAGGSTLFQAAPAGISPLSPHISPYLAYISPISPPHLFQAAPAGVLLAKFVHHVDPEVI